MKVFRKSLTHRQVCRAYRYIALAALLIICIVVGSSTYERCYGGREEDGSRYASEEPHDISEAAGRLWRCGWLAINENDGLVVGLFTAALVLVTRELWRETRNLARQAREQASDTKALIAATNTIGEAAKESAAVAAAGMTAGRARMHVAIRESNFAEVVAAMDAGRKRQDTFVPVPRRIRLEFVNYGKVHATIQQIWLAGPTFSVDPPEALSPHPRREPYEIMLVGGGSTEYIDLEDKAYIDMPDAQAFFAGSRFFWVRGRVYYRDAIEGGKVHRFLLRYRYVNGQGVLEPHDHKDWNESI